MKTAEDEEFERIEREIKMRQVPDALHHTDTSASIEYITGWNDCRAAMLTEQPAQQEPVLQDIGYWKGGVFDGIHSDYDTAALQDDAALYAKFDELYNAQPAQRTWVGLTEKERYQIFYSFGVSFVAIEHIESKLKEKNT